MKFSSSVFSFCFWWLILENEGPSLTSWSSVPLACYFLLLFSHWDGRADQSVALTPKSTFWQGCPTSWHTPAKFQAQNFFQGPSSCFFFFFGEGYYSGSHIFVLTDKRFDKWWHWVESWFICRCWRPWAWVGEGNICFRIRICPGMSPPHPFSVPSPSVPAQTQVGTTVHIFVISLTSQLCSEKSPQIFHIISTFCRKRLTEMYNTRMCLQE